MESDDVVKEISTRLSWKFDGYWNKPERLQIHFAGTQRTGKTIQAEIARQVLISFRHFGLCPVIIDVDATRATIFGDNEPKIGSPLQHLMQAMTYEAIFGLRIPDIIASGGVSIMTATHSRREYYDRALAVSQKYNTRLRFIILETPSIEEVARRCTTSSTSDKSDMNDLRNERNRKVYLDTVARFESAYQDFKEPHLRIPQDAIEKMATQAMRYILSTKA